MRFVITESEKNQIKGLYEQQTKTVNLFTYKDILKNILESMSSILENKPVSQVCQNLDAELKPTFGMVDDLLVRIAQDSGMPEDQAIKYIYDTWEKQKSSGMGLLLKLIGSNMTVAKEMSDKLSEYIRTKPSGSLLNSIVSDIMGKAGVKQIPICK
jgi:(p)ppGpp synthase/HD superfamily hydrolase